MMSRAAIAWAKTLSENEAKTQKKAYTYTLTKREKGKKKSLYITKKKGREQPNQ